MVHRDARTSLRVSVSRLLLTLQDFCDGGGPRGLGGLLLPVEFSLALQQFSLKPVIACLEALSCPLGSRFLIGQFPNASFCHPKISG